MFRSLDVAAISFVPENFDIDRNSDRLEAMFREAAGFPTAAFRSRR